MKTKRMVIAIGYWIFFAVEFTMYLYSDEIAMWEIDWTITQESLFLSHFLHLVLNPHAIGLFGGLTIDKSNCIADVYNSTLLGT